MESAKGICTDNAPMSESVHHKRKVKVEHGHEGRRGARNQYVELFVVERASGETIHLLQEKLAIFSMGRYLNPFQVITLVFSQCEESFQATPGNVYVDIVRSKFVACEDPKHN